MGGFVSCAADFNDRCSDILVENNLVAGAQFAGYVVEGHACGAYSSSKFKNNIAQGNKGVGAIIYP